MCFSFIVILYEKNNTKPLLFWFIITLTFPIIGFSLYLLFGNSLKIKARAQIKQKKNKTKIYLRQTDWYKNYKHTNIRGLLGFKRRVFEYINRNGFNSWKLNDVRVYTQGESFVNDLEKDLLNATSSINLQFYIFADDEVGKRISNVIIKKAQEGVLVNVLYDSFGSQKTSSSFWNNLESNGVNVVSFFPPYLKFINTKINYRNHRKIAIIDGKVAYTGGINIRDDHMGKDPKIFPWRDTQIRLTGGAVYAFQDIFLNDYLFASNNKLNSLMTNLYFPKMLNYGNDLVQVVCSGPEKDRKYILETYQYMIKNSKKNICIETPYFIIDKMIVDELIGAKNRGVNIQIIIPGKPDKKLVYGMTLHTIKRIVYEDINIYLYDGFIHSKMLIVDNVCSVGTCNFDNRSFNLNFENTVFFYDKTVEKMIDIFNEDKNNSEPLTIKKYKKLTKKYKNYVFFYKFLSKLL